ncbi:MAG TPA: hypothetical protein VLG68_00860, partial [Gammaproteobacteria bacterium]|nr:hypothetical protein [Gammaproteobacteria bacterium]
MADDKAQASARAGFQQAASLFSQGRAADAAPLLEQAARAGDGDAMNLLGVMCLNGIGVEQAPRRAAAFFKESSGRGLKEAQYNLSNVLYNGLGVACDESQAQAHLLMAARAGHKPALRSLAFLYHFMGDVGTWPTLATRCFRRAAEAGDALSKYYLGLRLLRGLGATADPAEARSWLEAAAQDRVWLAPARLAEIPQSVTRKPVATSSGETGEWPDFDLPKLAPAPASYAKDFMSEHLSIMDEFLCDHFMNVAGPRLAPSGVVDPVTGGALRSDKRTSYSMYYQASMYDAIAARGLQQIAAIAGLPPQHAEPLGILRYGPGQEYRPHYDYYSDTQHEA